MSPRRRLSPADFFENLEEPRDTGRNFRHPLVNVVLRAVIGVACGQKTFTAISDFVKGQIEWFGQILDMSYAVPSEDTYRRVFEA